MMLLNADEMSKNNNYGIPVAVIQRLLDAAAAAARYKWNEDLSASERDAQVSGKLGVQLADVVGIRSVLQQLVRLESSPASSSTVSPASDVITTDYPPQQQQQVSGERSKRTSKSSTVVVVNPARYKTELCRQFEEHGSCRYGDKCQFAHGAAELRSLVRHPKYKTEMCRTFHTTGFCPYGLRCHFIHNDDERRAAAAVLDAAGRGRDPGGPLSPPSLPVVVGDQLLVAHPPPPNCRPIFRSSSSSMSPRSITTLFTPETDSEQRGRPILARSSTSPDRSASTYHSVASSQHVDVSFFADLMSPAT